MKLDFSAPYWSLDQAKPWASRGIRNSFPGRRNPRISKEHRQRLRSAWDSIWSEQEDRAKTSTRNLARKWQAASH